MPLNDYQMEAGVTMGPGTNYIIENWDGYGSTAYRTSDDPAPLDHGEWTGPEYLTGRSLTLDVVVRGDTEEEAVTNADLLIGAWYLDTRTDGYGATLPLTVKLPGRDERILFGRPRRIKCDTDKISGTNVPAKLEYFAPDPRWYSSTLHSQGITYNSSASGRGYNSPASGRSYDYGYGGGGQSNAVTITNAGTFNTLPSVRITGPAVNPYIFNETTGETLYLTYSLPSGEYLDINFKNRTVLLNGTASRYYAKSGEWFELVPGANQIRFGLSTTDWTPQVSMTWRDAWL